MLLSTILLCAKEQRGSLEGMGSLGLTATTVQAVSSLVGPSPMGTAWWAEPGGGTRLHQQPQRGGVKTWVQGQSRVFIQGEKEKGPETGMETKLQSGSEVHAGGRDRDRRSCGITGAATNG